MPTKSPHVQYKLFFIYFQLMDMEVPLYIKYYLELFASLCRMEWLPWTSCCPLKSSMLTIFFCEVVDFCHQWKVSEVSRENEWVRKQRADRSRIPPVPLSYIGPSQRASRVPVDLYKWFGLLFSFWRGQVCPAGMQNLWKRMYLFPNCCQRKYRPPCKVWISDKQWVLC